MKNLSTLRNRLHRKWSRLGSSVLWGHVQRPHRELQLAFTTATQLEFPNPGSFCKPGSSGLERSNPGFGFGFGFGSHVGLFAFTANWWGGGSDVDRWIGWANFFGSLSIISCCKIANIVGLIL